MIKTDYKSFNCLCIPYLPAAYLLVVSRVYLGNVSKGLIFLRQLPARKEPVLDSTKYTAADVRIVSSVSMIYNSLHMNFFLDIE